MEVIDYTTQNTVEPAVVTPGSELVANVVAIANAVAAATAPTVAAKGPKMHKCAKCGAEFAGSGKRGRPNKLCPACRPAKA